MSDHNERACTKCGSLLHHEDVCAARTPDIVPAAVTISRMSNPETIHVRVVVEKEVIEVEMTLAEFALALTGRGDAKATLFRRFRRP